MDSGGAVFISTTRDPRDPKIAEMPIEAVQAAIVEHVRGLSLGKSRSLYRTLVSKKVRPPPRRSKGKLPSMDKLAASSNLPYILRVLRIIETMRYPTMGLVNRGYTTKVCASTILDDELGAPGAQVSAGERTRQLICIGETLACVAETARSRAVETSSVVVVEKHESRQGHGKLRGSGVALDAAGASLFRAAAADLRTKIVAASERDGCSSDKNSEIVED